MRNQSAEFQQLRRLLYVGAFIVSALDLAVMLVGLVRGNWTEFGFGVIFLAIAWFCVYIFTVSFDEINNKGD